MNIILKVPFYSNTPDNIHCVQACMKMVLEYFSPDKKLSFEEWDKISCHKEGLWTWSMASLIWFKKNNFEVINIEAFEYEHFSNEGEKYIIDFFGEEVGQSQIRHSDIQQEIIISRDFIKEIESEIRVPNIQDIRSLLKNGFVVVCSINANALDDLEGYSGHSIVVKGCTDSGLIIQDPGLPPRQDYEVCDAQFYKSWAYPDEKAPNLTAFKLNI